MANADNLWARPAYKNRIRHRSMLLKDRRVHHANAYIRRRPSDPPTSAIKNPVAPARGAIARSRPASTR